MASIIVNGEAIKLYVSLVGILTGSPRQNGYLANVSNTKFSITLAKDICQIYAYAKTKSINLNLGRFKSNCFEWLDSGSTTSANIANGLALFNGIFIDAIPIPIQEQYGPARQLAFFLSKENAAKVLFLLKNIPRDFFIEEFYEVVRRNMFPMLNLSEFNNAQLLQIIEMVSKGQRELKYFTKGIAKGAIYIANRSTNKSTITNAFQVALKSPASDVPLQSLSNNENEGPPGRPMSKLSHRIQFKRKVLSPLEALKEPNRKAIFISRADFIRKYEEFYRQSSNRINFPTVNRMGNFLQSMNTNDNGNINMNEFRKTHKNIGEGANDKSEMLKFLNSKYVEIISRF
jgi:hypothetical protein